MSNTATRTILHRFNLQYLTNSGKTVARKFSHSSIMSAPTKEWLAIIPDKPDSLQKRLAVRHLHLEKVKPRVAAGEVVFGGATLDEQPSADTTPAMNGSVMLFKAETEEDVRKLIENDDYTKNDVWDAAKAQIMPFKCAIRTALTFGRSIQGSTMTGPTLCNTTIVLEQDPATFFASSSPPF